MSTSSPHSSQGEAASGHGKIGLTGLVVGAIARFLMPGEQKMGWIMTILLGICGSIAATYGGQALGIYQAGQAAGFIGAVVGAVVLLLLYGALKKG